MSNLIFLYSFALWICLTYGYGRFRFEIPNGLIVKHPCNGDIWEAVGHMSPHYTQQKNAFGGDVRTMVRAGPFDWSQICNKDSDGDGMTNGQELGDPNCVWKRGTDAPGPVMGHPGFCESDRSQCTSGVTHRDCPNPFANSAPSAPRNPSQQVERPQTRGGIINFNPMTERQQFPSQPMINWRGPNPMGQQQNRNIGNTGGSIFGPQPQVPGQMQMDRSRGQQNFPQFPGTPTQNFPWQSQDRSFQGDFQQQQPMMRTPGSFQIFRPQQRLPPRMQPTGGMDTGFSPMSSGMGPGVMGQGGMGPSPSFQYPWGMGGSFPARF